MRHAKKLTQRIGRRGTFLLFLTLVDFIFGGTMINPPAEAAQSKSTRFFAGIAPLWLWALLWIAVGVVLAVGAFRRNDRWAYTVAIGLKVFWGGVTLFGYLLAGLDRGWVSTIFFGGFALLTYVVAGWPEPSRPLLHADDGEAQ